MFMFSMFIFYTTFKNVTDKRDQTIHIYYGNHSIQHLVIRTPFVNSPWKKNYYEKFQSVRVPTVIPVLLRIVQDSLLVKRQTDNHSPGPVPVHASENKHKKGIYWVNVCVCCGLGRGHALFYPSCIVLKLLQPPAHSPLRPSPPPTRHFISCTETCTRYVLLQRAK